MANKGPRRYLPPMRSGVDIYLINQDSGMDCNHHDLSYEGIIMHTDTLYQRNFRSSDIIDRESRIRNIAM